MKEDIVAKLTAKDDKFACALADKIISESQETDEWYEYFDDFSIPQKRLLMQEVRNISDQVRL